MNKLKQQFLNMRDATPKGVQWLLLAATFIVVLILLALLVMGHERKPKVSSTEETPVKITLSADTVNWADVTVGTKEKTTITVTATAPAKVSMGQNKTIDGFSAKTTCTDAAVINSKISCNIFLEYVPTIAAKPETLTLSIYYRGESEPEEMKSAEKVMVILGATAPTPVVTPKPAPAPTPVPEPEDDYDDFVADEPSYIAPLPAKQIETEIKAIAPGDPFATEPTITINTPSPAQPARPSESCSDFAFPGYDSYGTQIGWIKPERGGYYFYPFADKNCKNATGIYNPDSGIITDINVAGKRIGTDVEHINTALATGLIPTLAESPRAVTNVRTAVATAPVGTMGSIKESNQLRPAPVEDVIYDTTDPNAIVSTQPYDRTFILRQYKPIPATIVSDVRADTALDADNMHFPVRATVDRNVYSDNGRTVILPAGTMLLGYVTGKVPGPYKAIGRMNIKWYQFVLPNGVEFNFAGDAQEPVSADAQGRIGVPGRGSTDYIEQFVMPMLTAIVPAAVNMIAPVADKFVNQIDLDNNTVVQSGTIRSSELAKNEIITAWNQVAQKLLVDMMDNTVPPFTIPAGTRITVYSPNDLMVACTTNEKCMVRVAKANTSRATPNWAKAYADPNDGSWVGQARSFNLESMCTNDPKTGAIKAKDYSAIAADLTKTGYSYSTVVAYCQASNYQAINNARQEALYQNQQSVTNTNSVASTGGKGTQTYNEQVLGLKYNESGAIENPFQKTTETVQVEDTSLKCLDGANPDANGCCAGEIYTDMGEQGFNCCPEAGGDCFPPIL